MSPMSPMSPTSPTSPTSQGRGNGRNRVRSVAVAAGILALVVVLAATLPQDPVFVRGPGADRSLVPDLPVLAYYLLVGLVIVAVLAWAFLQVMTLRARGRARRRGAAPVWVQILIVLLALFLPALAGRNLTHPGGRQAQISSRDSSSGSTGEPGSESNRSKALGIVITLLLGVLLVAIVAGTTWLFWPAAVPPGVPDVDDRALLSGIDAGLEDLERIADPRSAVIACYARMQGLTAAAGIDRRAADTPVELLRKILVSYHAAESSAIRLTDLFERARFSPHEVDETMRAEALEALREIKDQLLVTS